MSSFSVNFYSLLADKQVLDRLSQAARTLNERDEYTDAVLVSAVRGDLVVDIDGETDDGGNLDTEVPSIVLFDEMGSTMLSLTRQEAYALAAALIEVTTIADLG